MSNSKVKEAFEPVYIGTWGPQKVNFKGHERYFLITVVDDHITMTWIYLMKQKYDAYEALSTFVNMDIN